MRRGAKPGKAKVKTRVSLARKSPKNEASGRCELEKRLAEALDQQIATAEILKVISGTPTDAQPVFDTIVRNAGRACDAVDAVLILRKDEELTTGAHWGPIGTQLGNRRPLTRGSVMGRAIVDARPIHVEDLLTASEFPEGRELAIRWGHRTTLAVPLLREGDALGALLIRRTEVRPFSDAQIAMRQTFAAQAVIAIENVRLFTELQENNRALTEAHAQVTEALEQQTATAEILRVISRSPTDVQPVFETIAKNARRLCKSDSASVLRLDGAHLHLETVDNASEEGSEALRKAYPSPVSQRSAGGRAVLTGRAVHIPDVLEDPDSEFAGLQGAGLRSILARRSQNSHAHGR